MLRTFLFFFGFISILAADTSSNEDSSLSGSFKYPGETPKLVSFSVNWFERHGIVRGIYSDNYFSKSEIVSGENGPNGAHLIVNFPTEKFGTKSLVFFLPHPISSKNLGQSLGLVTRDQLGRVKDLISVNNIKFVNSFNTDIQMQEESECTRGFGEISGFCGLYAGLISETEDRRNMCNLLLNDAVKLELTKEGVLFLHFGEVNEILSSPGHLIGRIPFNPQKMSVDIMGRICEQMVGVKSSTDSCKIVHLKGKFSHEKEIKTFKGTYRISEEGTNKDCLYKLSLERKI
jgi:hypothetical protein